MPLLINTKHAPGKSIKDIYFEMTEDKSHAPTRERGINMLKIIEIINKLFPNTQIWALTSIGRLVLQIEDDWKSDWFVIINCLSDEYYIEYLLPESKRPWPRAYVRGEVRGLVEAKKYLLIAMKECGAWKDNLELFDALKERI